MPNCLDNMPWRSLKGLGKYAADFLQLGDYRNVVLKNGAQVQFRIIGFNHDKTSDGSLAPISWEMVDCLPNTYPWNRRVSFPTRFWMLSHQSLSRQLMCTLARIVLSRRWTLSG